MAFAPTVVLGEDNKTKAPTDGWSFGAGSSGGWRGATDGAPREIVWGNRQEVRAIRARGRNMMCRRAIQCRIDTSGRYRSRQILKPVRRRGRSTAVLAIER